MFGSHHKVGFELETNGFRVQFYAIVNLDKPIYPEMVFRSAQATVLRSCLAEAGIRVSRT